MKIKDLKVKAIITISIIIYAAVIYALPGVTCPVLALTGIKCPGCGMTRALISAIRLNFIQAFEYHIMFWSVPFLYLSFLFDGKLLKNKTLNIVLHIAIGIGFAINWLFCKIF